MEPDPFTILYEAIWTLLEDFSSFTTAVREGNRIKLDGGSRKPQKRSLMSADLPEVTIEPAGALTEIHANSSQTRMTRRHTIMINTGDNRIDIFHFPIQFYVIRALTEWKKTIGGITWSNHPFLTDLEIPDTIEGESDAKANRNIQGYSSILALDAQLTFPTALLRLP